MKKKNFISRLKSQDTFWLNDTSSDLRDGLKFIILQACLNNYGILNQ